MAKYYINRAEPFSKGMKLELSQEGKQYPIKNVTLWNDHPRYNEFVAGKELEFELYEKDSANINPNTNAHYKDRSVSKFDTPQQSAPTSDMGVKTHIDRSTAAIMAQLKVIQDGLNIPNPPEKIAGTSVNYPESATSNGSGEITENDVPF